MDKKDWQFIPLFQRLQMFVNAALRYEGRLVSCDRCAKQNLCSCVASEAIKGVDLCLNCFSTLFEVCGWCAREGMDVYGRKLSEEGSFSTPPEDFDAIVKEYKEATTQKQIEQNGVGERGAKGGKMSLKQQNKFTERVGAT